MNIEAVVAVRISIFKPTGFEDIHYIATEDRGKAAKKVMEMYPDDQLAYLNYITVTLCNRQKYMNVVEL